MDTIKRFSSQTQAEFFIANTATEGKPVLLRVVLDDRVQTGKSGPLRPKRVI